MIDKLNGQETRIVNILDDTTEIKEVLAIDIRIHFRITRTDSSKNNENRK